jgi:RNA recognition motif-containing protein
MGSAEQGQAAISGMNGKELKGRKLNVNEARPRQDDGRGGGGGMRRPGGGGGRPRY